MDGTNIDALVLFVVALSITNVLLLVLSIRSSLRQRSAMSLFLSELSDIVTTGKEEAIAVEAAPKRSQCKKISPLMSKVTEDRLMEDFEKARRSMFYLKKGVNLNDLAELLGTNQRYVTYIVNKSTGMDFNTFVQKGRVDHLIECVKKDPDLLNEKFAVLADKVGFSSTSKFSSVFKLIKGVSPSEFFQVMKRDLEIDGY
ncbi:helix-turn-helix domain-containing protein [Sphingobacterium suaedae]|uniref:Helix-turn-helix domain-containing protein n=1 Tax=Sphingobacterium suaedae TaxID=1686402 RepID=A0ABW5KNQ3_9SPHI